MYLSKKKIVALNMAIEAMENFHVGYNNKDEEEAIDILVKMLHDAEKNQLRQANLYRQKKKEQQIMQCVIAGFESEENYEQ